MKTFTEGAMRASIFLHLISWVMIIANFYFQVDAWQAVIVLSSASLILHKLEEIEEKLDADRAMIRSNYFRLENTILKERQP